MVAAGKSRGLSGENPAFAEPSESVESLAPRGALRRLQPLHLFRIAKDRLFQWRK
jgi:hypothetical protein